MSEWINVKDSRPVELVPILFYAYNEYENGFIVRYGMYRAEDGYESYEGDGNRYYSEDDVTHWMSAPRPPI